jgi:lipopolysaccharide/colanic/teichoic acid biosynthesis glycosyltransferase
MIRRLFDLTVSSLALLVLAMPFLAIMVVLRFTGEGKVWFLQERMGFRGKTFKVFKFVTMCSDAEFTGNKDITLRGDPRVLPVGRFLRKAKLNELPQILNVIRGEMSLVGWRPLVPRGFADYAPKIQGEIVKIKPGLTGVGSLVFRDEEAIVSAHAVDGRSARDVYREEILPFKGELELWYQEHRSLWLDLRILIATAILVLVPSACVWRLISELPRPTRKALRGHFAFDPS